MKKSLNSLSLLFVFLIPVACANDGTATTGINNALGDHIEIIKNSNKVEIAKLNVTNFNSAKKNVFADNKHIAGYPITGKILTLNNQQKSEIIKTLLNEKSYISLRARCKNSYFLGIRFIMKNEKVEFALGIPCQQAIWAIPTNSGSKLWGSVLSNIAAKRITSIFKKN